MTKIKDEKFLSNWDFEHRFHLHIGRFSLIMLDPTPYGYMYELYDLKSEKVIGRYDSIIDVVDKIKSLSKIKKR